ncbi:putative cystine transporter YijE [Propionicimonas sp. T2.31MG-18]|jgi:drug/metabolite transporter (DMT)-like permease
MGTGMPRPALVPRPGRMVLITAGWGACFVAIRWGLQDAPLLWFAALRSLVAGAVVLLAAVGTGWRPPPRAAWPWVLVLGLVNVALAYAAMFAGTAGVSSGVAAVLANSQPLLMVLPAWLLFRERPTRWALAGLLLGFVGLGVAAAASGAGTAGALLSLASSAATVVGTLIARRLVDVDVVALTALQFLVGGAALAAWAAAAEGAPKVAWTPQFLAVLAFIAVIGTAATNLLWFAEVRRAELVRLTAWTMLTPVFGVLLGWLLLSEAPTPRQWLGIVLVLAALPLIQLRSPRNHPAAVTGGTSSDAVDPRS